MPKKFPVRRDNKYYIDGLSLPSVTTISGSFPKPFLIPWAAKMGAKFVLDAPDKYDTAEEAARAVSQIKFDAAERGTRVHAMVEHWARGGDLAGYEVPAGYEGYLRSLQSFVRAWSPAPLHVEVIVYNKTLGYAGRCDLICRIGSEIWLLDFKTSKAVYLDYKLQLVAYKHAEFFLEKDDPAIYPMLAIDRTGVVLLRPNGEFDFKSTEAPLEVFLALKTLYDYAHEEDD